MPALAANWVLLLVGDSFSFREKFMAFRGLGIKNEIETASGNEKHKLNEGVSTIEVPRRREIKVNISGIKGVRKKETVEVKALAPFAAKSFSELGLPPLLVERLEREGNEVSTDVQAAAIPPILKNNDVVNQSYTGPGKRWLIFFPYSQKCDHLRRMFRDKMDIEAVIVLDLKIRDWCNNLEKIRQALKRKGLLKRTSHPLSLDTWAD
ncbi:unnamed protein product [Fraxinus pennsylvanica]|uniref:RNA helicase n=1 Tax=Fraxinus pennsylvanica TaxID=56036 RepID=A0AAD1YQJ5_9LAMI|nr:unnamed protein product [Fraxinus pennsylvanica]